MPKEAVGPFLESKEFAAINVTIPTRNRDSYLAHIDPAAQAIGAVNTIVNRGGELWGLQYAVLPGWRPCCAPTASRFRVENADSGQRRHCKTAYAVAGPGREGNPHRRSRHPSDGQISYEQALKQRMCR